LKYLLYQIGKAYPDALNSISTFSLGGEVETARAGLPWESTIILKCTRQLIKAIP
jgi:hypothetical protein